MEVNNMELMPGLYGSQICKERACGFCHYHNAALTVKTMKGHNCLGKQCDALEKYLNHDFWRQHEQKKALKKAKRQMLMV